MNVGRWLAIFSVLLAASDQARGADGPADLFAVLTREYEAKFRVFFLASSLDGALTDEEHRKLFAPTEDERQKAIAAEECLEREYASRFLALAVADPKGPRAIEALARAVELGGRSGVASEAIRRLRADHVADPKMAEVIYEVAKSSDPQVEGLLREVIARNPDRAARGMATWALGSLLAGQAEMPFHREQDPAIAKMIDAIYPKARLDQFQADAPAMVAEAEALHELVVREYKDVSLYPGYPTETRTIGEQAERWLADRRVTAIGKSAPEIDGVDLDGKPLRLGDYRGKVVVLVFWGTWCHGSNLMMPQLRELNRLNAGRPLAILGVNCDHKLERAKDAVEREGLAWPHWFDDGVRPGSSAGRIARLYHVQGVPHTFVIDAQGIIRHKERRGEGLKEAVGEMLGRTLPPG